MDDFLLAFNRKQQENAEPGTVERPFICDPSLLPLAERQELIYKYQYLEETTEALALHYRLAPVKVKQWLNEQGIERKKLFTDEDAAEFEEHVSSLYKSIQTRLLGLTVLHSAKAWQTLATAEEDLLASVRNAAQALSKQELPDYRVISSLSGTHERLVNRHKLIQEALEKAKDGGLFKAITAIERRIVDVPENLAKEAEE